METPTMLAMQSASTSYAGTDFAPATSHSSVRQVHNAVDRQAIFERQAQQLGVQMANVPARRIVQVFIADSNENIPLESCVLYKGEQKLTDATDQELFFEVDIKTILDTHNAKRTKMIDKKVKDRTEYLEPAKVRDLKMVVVTVASL